MRRSIVSIAIVAAFVLSAREAQAEGPPRGLVAVLPLDVASAKIEKADRVSLEESVRTLAGDALRPLGYTVLNSDNTLAVLADNNIDATKICEASCALQAARELKATYFVAGTVTTTERQHFVFLRLLESSSGSQLGSVRLRSARVEELIAQLDVQASTLFEPLNPKRTAVVTANRKAALVGNNRMAVMPLDFTEATRLEGRARNSFERAVEESVTSALQPAGWTILTTHNELQMLADNAMDASSCDQSCLETIARQCKAWKFLTGSVALEDGFFIASFQLIDTDSGRVLAEAKARNESLDVLRTEFGAQARAMFVKAGMLE